MFDLQEVIGALMQDYNEHDGMVCGILMAEAESMLNAMLKDPSSAAVNPCSDTWDLEELVAWALLQMQGSWRNDVAYRWLSRKIRERVNTWIANSHAVEPDNEWFSRAETEDAMERYGWNQQTPSASMMNYSVKMQAKTRSRCMTRMTQNSEEEKVKMNNPQMPCRTCLVMMYLNLHCTPPASGP